MAKFYLISKPMRRLTCRAEWQYLTTLLLLRFAIIEMKGKKQFLKSVHVLPVKYWAHSFSQNDIQNDTMDKAQVLQYLDNSRNNQEF